MNVTAPTALPPRLGEAYFRQLCEHLGLALIATDADLAVRVWNAAATRMFGAGAERMQGASVLSFLPMEWRGRTEKLLHRTLEFGEPADFEFEQRDAQGLKRQLIVTVAPVVAETGERTGVSLCIRDITHRIALQDELNESRKLSALGEMAGAVAHHFNNILGGIVTGIDYIRTDNDPQRTAKVLDQISRSLLRATTLVNGLLLVSQGDRRADDLADFTEIITEVADDAEKTCAQQNIRFLLDMPPLPVTPVPRNQVKNVLRNVIQNAIEAMPTGGDLTVKVGLEAERLAIAITDTGPGLDEESRVRVFEPFFSTKDPLGSERGVPKGLGLAIAHGLLKVMGGSIRVDSEVGKGSSFTIILPR